MRLIKYIIFPIWFFTFFSVSSPAQWTLQQSGTTNNLNSVYFISNNLGFTVGASGTILKTTNGGSNWVTLNSGTSVNLASVRFINSFTGWAVGDNGTILRTINGGNNWTVQSASVNHVLRSVFFTTSRTGYICGDSIILKTTNRGLNWMAQSADNMKIFYSVYFVNSNTGWITGYSLLKTTNGGANWLTILPITEGRSIYFPNANTGWYSGGEYLLSKSTDGGLTWGSDTSGVQDSPPATFTGVHFLNSSTGWFTSTHVFGGRILMTTNGGLNWNTDYPTTLNRRLNGIFMRQAALGWAVGEQGTILRRGIVTEISNNGIEQANSFTLFQNYPNPFNPSTEINFSIPQDNYVTLKVYSVTGSMVSVLINNEHKSKGIYKLSFDASKLSSGVYFYELQAGSYSEIKKMVLIK